MGCDIYAFLETSKDGGKTWQLYREPIMHRYKEYNDKIKKEKWVPTDLVDPGGYLNVGRDYWLFGIMAGVRTQPDMWGKDPNELNGVERALLKLNKEEPIRVGEAKGMPKDASSEVIKIWGPSKDSGDHSPSWGTLRELQYWLKLHKQRGGSFYGWGKIRDRMVKLEKKVKTRLVFWFNS